MTHGILFCVYTCPSNEYAIIILNFSLNWLNIKIDTIRILRASKLIPEHVYSFYYYFKLKNKMKFIYVKSSCRAHIHTHRCWLLVLGTLFF